MVHLRFASVHFRHFQVVAYSVTIPLQQREAYRFLCHLVKISQPFEISRQQNLENRLFPAKVIYERTTTLGK